MKRSTQTVILYACAATALASTIWLVASGGDDPAPAPIAPAPEVSTTPLVDRMLAKQRARLEHTPDDRLARTPVAGEVTPVYIIPDEFLAPPLLPYEERALPPDEPAQHDGAVSTRELIEHYPGLSTWLVDNMNPNLVPKMRRCKLDLIARGALINERHDWKMALHVVGDGRIARVNSVAVHPDSWPSMFDEEARACFARAVSEVSFPASDVVDVMTEWEFCVTPEGKVSP